MESEGPGEHANTARRGRIGLRAGIALCLTDMVGVGPFLTLPLIIGAMGGPPVVLAWAAGAVFALCDALVWSELAAAYPEAGGTYAYLRRIFPGTGGRYASFLFAAQVCVSAPLSMATGCIGVGKYLAFLLPGMDREWAHVALPAGITLALSGSSLAAAAVACVAIALVCRGVQGIGRIAQVLAAGTVLTLLLMIIAGFTHWHPQLLQQVPRGTWAPRHLALLLPAGLLIAFYDFWGYYNVAFLGDEVADARRNIPRAMLWSVVITAALYILMTVSVLGVVPWQQASSPKTLQSLDLAAAFTARVWGTTAGRAMALLVIWAAAASVFSLLTGYSRIVFAAARDGALPSPLAKLHRQGYPANAVLMLGGITFCFCFLRVEQLITALVVVRVVLQFGLQAVGLLWLRWKRPEAPRPFRMWLYPLPVLVALCGFALVLADKAALLAKGVVLAALVSTIFLVMERRRRSRLVS